MIVYSNDSELLFYPIRDGHIELIRLFIQYGVKIESIIYPKHYMTSLVLASRNGHVEVVKLILDSGGDPNYRLNLYDDTALMAASESGHIEVVRVLLER